MLCACFDDSSLAKKSYEKPMTGDGWLPSEKRLARSFQGDTCAHLPDSSAHDCMSTQMRVKFVPWLSLTVELVLK
jgi:hypothetical protein